MPARDPDANDGGEICPDLPDLELPPQTKAERPARKAAPADDDFDRGSGIGDLDDLDTVGSTLQVGELDDLDGLQLSSAHSTRPHAAASHAIIGEMDDFALDSELGGGASLSPGSAGYTIALDSDFDAFGFDGSSEDDPDDCGLELRDPHLGRPKRTSDQQEVPWPTGQSPNRSGIDVLPAQIAHIAGFGKAPSWLLLAPLYAGHVMLRRRVLRQQLAEHTTNLLEAERDRDRLLADIAQARRAELETDGRFAEDLAKADSLAQQLGALGRELTAVDHAHAIETAKHVKHIENRRAAVEAAKALQRTAEIGLETAKANLTQAELKRKRLEIDLHRAQRGAEESAPAVAGREIEDIVEQINASEPELVSLGAVAATERAMFEQARIATKHAENNLKKQVDQQQRANEIFARDRRTRTRAVVTEETAYSSTLGDIMRIVLVRPQKIQLDRVEIDSIRQADERVGVYALTAEQYFRAYTSHDPELVRRGFVLGGILLLLLIAPLCWLCVR